jgi:hypothetical protein
MRVGMFSQTQEQTRACAWACFLKRRNRREHAHAQDLIRLLGVV